MAVTARARKRPRRSRAPLPPPRDDSEARTAVALAREYRLGPQRSASLSDEQALGRDPGGWLLELAWDGHRVLACRAGDDVRLVSADHREWGDAFPTIAAALRSLPAREAVLEGHVCALDERAHPTFALLKDAAHARGKAARLVFAASDLLALDGEDLRGLALPERRARLVALLANAPSSLLVSEALSGGLDALRAAVRGLGVRGLLARPAGPAADAPCLAVSADGAPLLLERGLSPAPRVTNRAKVLYPRDGLTKEDVVGYYDDVAPVLLPYLRDRPVVCQRWPDGIDGTTWYQHRVPPRAPDYLRGAWIDGDRRVVVDDARALVWLANLAALTFHGWASRLGSLEHADWALLDLDPGEGTTWSDTVEVAVAVRRLLELLELPSVVKTSGQRGLHVLVPLAPGQTLARAQELARRMAVVIARLLPEKVSLAMDRAARGGRLYLDHIQGFVGKSLVLPYSLRAVDGAPASTPLDWSEVTAALDPRALSLRTMRRRLDARGDLARPLLDGRGALLAGALDRLSP